MGKILSLKVLALSYLVIVLFLIAMGIILYVARGPGPDSDIQVFIIFALLVVSLISGATMAGKIIIKGGKEQ